jgi:cytochrome-b5 reductase
VCPQPTTNNTNTTTINHTTANRFALPEPEQEAGLPVASCLLVKAPLQGPGDDKPKAVIRPYTPTSAPDAKGHLDLVIKAYPEGKMSKHLGELKVGDSVDFKG